MPDKLTIKDLPFAKYVSLLTEKCGDHSTITLADATTLIETWIGQDGNLILLDFYRRHEREVFIARLLGYCGWRKTRITRQGKVRTFWVLNFRHDLGQGWDCEHYQPCGSCVQEQGGDPDAVMAELLRQAGLED